MSSKNKIYYFRGVGKWCKVQTPDKKFGFYTLDLYLDDESLQMFKDSGLGLKLRESEDGLYIKLRREPERLIAGDVVNIGPPKVFLLSGDKAEPFDGLIGNGSKIVCKVSVYDGPRGKGHRLESVGVEELVEFVGGEVVNEEEFPF